MSHRMRECRFISPYIYSCIYVNVHIYLSNPIYLSDPIYLYLHLSIYIHICVYLFIYVCVYENMWIYVYIYVCLSVCVCVLCMYLCRVVAILWGRRRDRRRQKAIFRSLTPNLCVPVQKRPMEAFSCIVSVIGPASFVIRLMRMILNVFRSVITINSNSNWCSCCY